jgi:hypothetical protein
LEDFKMTNDDILKILAENSTRQTEVLQALKEALSSKDNGLHTKTPASFQTATPLHGSGGIFSTSGLERDVITAHVRPRGLAGTLPLIPSVSEDPRFATLTGYTDVVGAEPTNACDDAPAGYVKGCNLTARFGLVRRDTQTIEMDKVMLKLNRGDFTDLVLRGRVLGLTNLEPSGMNESQILDVVTMSEMVNTAVQTERVLNRQFWQGTVAIANEFPGLDAQIATGQIDADTATACPALDSDVKNYNYATLSASIVDYMSQLEWYLKYNAQSMGLDPVQWAWVVRPDLWYELTAIWPCAYNTTRCSPAAAQNSTVFIDGRENTAERDAMRNGMYIDVNGTRYPVVVDTGIYEQNNANDANVGAGQYASSIYMVPLSIGGGFPVLYREYVDYRAAQPDVSLLRGKEDFFWTDGGVYSWAIEQIKWCYKLALKTEQRVILRTPHLAGRIDNVLYSPLQHLRDPNPDSPYFADGGVSLRAGLAAPNAVWN